MGNSLSETCPQWNQGSFIDQNKYPVWRWWIHIRREIFKVREWIPLIGPLTNAPSTLIHTNSNENWDTFCSGYGYRPLYNAENDHRNRRHSKTLSRVERSENDALLKTLFSSVTILSENGDVIKIDTTGRWPLECGYPKWRTDATMRRVYLSMHIEGIKAFELFSLPITTEPNGHQCSHLTGLFTQV